MAVYDDQGNNNTTTLPSDDDLRDITGINGTDERDIDSRAHSDAASKKSASASDLSKAEASAGKDSGKDSVGSDESDKLGLGYTGNDQDDQPADEDLGKPKSRSYGSKFKMAFMGSRRRKIISATAVTAAIGGSFVGMSMFLAPLQMVGMVGNIQNHFFGTAESSMSRMTDRLMGHYLVKKVIPGMQDNKCTTTKVSKSCARVTPGNSPVAKLFNTWRDNNIESKLASQGIEIERNGGGNDATFRLKAPNLDPDGVSLGKYKDIINVDGDLYAIIDANDRDKVRAAVSEGVSNETRWKNVMYRMEAMSLLKRKYNAPGCFFACEGKKSIREWKTRNITERKMAARGIMVNIIGGRASERNLLFIECLISGLDCADYTNSDNDGNRSTKYETELRNRLRALSASGIDMDKLFKELDGARTNGLLVHAISKLGVDLATKISAKFIPIFGWIDMAVSIVKGSEELVIVAKYAAFMYSVGIFVDNFSSISAVVDEQKSGISDAALIGSANALFTSEGGVTAGQSPLYQAVMPYSQSSITSILNPPVYAENGVPAILSEICDIEPEPDALICPNESVDASAAGKKPLYQAAVVVGKGFNFMMEYNPGWRYISKPLIDAWFTVFSTLYGWIGNVAIAYIKYNPGSLAVRWILNQIPGYTELEDEARVLVGEKLLEYTAAFSAYMMSFIETDPRADNPNSVNNVSLFMGGADYVAAEVGQTALGFEAVSDAEATEIRMTYRAQEDEAFQQKSFFARYFDTNNERSAVVRFALSLPSIDLGTAQTIAASFLGNPLGVFGNMATSFAGGNRAGAALTTSAHGIQQTAMPTSHPVFTSDPEIYWDENDCSNPNQKKEWMEDESHFEINQDTMQLVTTEANGCKFLEAAINSNGGIYDKSFFPDEVPETTTGGSTTTTPPTTGTNVSKDGWQNPLPGSNYGNGWGVWVVLNGRPDGYHKGQDMFKAYNSPVYAAHDGKVTKSQSIGSCGWLYVIQAYDTPYYMAYQHIQTRSDNLKVGDEVKAGDPIGYVGRIGSCGSGDHLHFSVEKGNWVSAYADPLDRSINPLDVLP